MYNDDKLKIYYDAEFTGLQQDTKLISIGLISENGTRFYAEFLEAFTFRTDDWIKDNVINNLLYTHKEEHVILKKNNDSLYSILLCDTKENIKYKLIKWLLNEHIYSNKDIQIYSDCYAYDWVLFNDLIGENANALSIPEYIYYIPMDLSTALQIKGIDPDISREEFMGPSGEQYLRSIKPFSDMKDNCKHNSLWDAGVCKFCFDKLNL